MQRCLIKFQFVEIKKERIDDKLKLEKIHRELSVLPKDRNDELKGVNTILWNVEDELRIKEKNKEFDKEFIWLARLVYMWNDRRHAIKNKIDGLEQKQYIEYKQKKPSMFILEPLKIGDAFIINGMLREFAERYDIVLRIESTQETNIPYMFRDLTNISYIIDEEDSKIKIAEKDQRLHLRRTRDEKTDWYINDANLSPDIMFEKFFILKDRWREDQMYKKVIEKFWNN
jgi:hypothetical protein